MRETSSEPSDDSRSARAAAGPSPARRNARTIEPTGRPSPTRSRLIGSVTATSQNSNSNNNSNYNNNNTSIGEQELTADDSFSEERFISPATGSWESHSFDNEELSARSNSRSSSTTNLRDRRKQFDTTTPTLIDEEDGVEEDDEMVSLEQQARFRAFAVGKTNHPHLHQHHHPSHTLHPTTTTLQQHQLYDQQQQPADDSSMRRTPGASMYKSSFAQDMDAAALSSMRRTPGASAMHRSQVAMGRNLTPEELPMSVAGQGAGVVTTHSTAAATTSTSMAGSATAAAAPPPHDRGMAAQDRGMATQDRGMETVSAPGLGFGLTLSRSAVEDLQSKQQQQQQQQQKSRLWESYTSHSSSPHSGSVAVAGRLPAVSASETELPARPPLAPAPSGVTVVSGALSRNPEPRGPFSFTPWARSPSSSATTAADSQRHGAFSPNILRLTEDIGNLLHEDEDDDYALEIPSVFRGDGVGPDELSDFPEDWTGSYVFESEFGHRSARPAVPRPSTFVKDGKTRRRSNTTTTTTTTAQQNFLPNAQQPKPRRSGNEVFEFGKVRDEGASPQLLNFGGAFAPPLKDYPGSFMRPVASSFSDAVARAPSLPSSVAQQLDAKPHAFGGSMSSVSGSMGLPSQSFESYQQAPKPYGMQQSSFPGQNRFSSPVPTSMGMTMPYFVGGMQQHPQNIQPQSEMQATAREFVPMSRGAGTPQPYHAQSPVWHQTSPMTHYEASLEAASWHSSASYPSYGSSYGYGMQSQAPAQPMFGDARSAMTPSPHLMPLPTWQPVDPAMYQNMQQQQQHRGLDGMQSPYSAPPGVHPQVTSGNDNLYREQHRLKKDTKRGKRGKKKTKADKPTPASTAKKKTTKGDGGRPGSTTQSQDGNGDDTFVSASDDPVDAKRAELVESPSTRIAFKDFYRAFRGEERLSFQKAEEFALKSLEDGSLPDSVHWRVYVELADLAKRSNRYVEARRLYQKVCQLQPYASQGWLEYSKLEEECGHMNRVTNILHAGLEYCEYSENLLTRAVKHQEKMGNLGTARELLARLKHVGIDKVWRTVLEGALLEARAGNVSMARRVLKYLMHHVPWYGPLYLEAYKLERDQGHPMDALHIVERGLNAIPRYGPLWFGAFRLCEELDIAKKLYSLPNTMEMIERATVSISKELVWKVHLEAAQMMERAALEQAKENDPALDSLLAPARERFALTILTCPNNLRWKVWLAAARMELGIGNTAKARALFIRAHKVVPDKGRSATLLDCARLEEFVGDRNLARAVLCKGRVEYGHDWKVWLESVLLEIRSCNVNRAIEIVTNALELHHGTGRLWATLVQLSQFSGRDEAQNLALRRALNAVPKSGEVWCEGGRIHLNPFSDTFDLVRARRHLYFATKFTPQYGDSFIETLRLELLDQWLSSIAAYIWKKTKSGYEEGRLTKYITDVSLAISVAREKESDKDSLKSLLKPSYRDLVTSIRKKLRAESLRSSINLSDLRLACANADPNYGSLWFHCRRVPTDTPRRVIEDAAEDVADELHKYAHVYLAAMLRRLAVLSTISADKPEGADSGIETLDPAVIQWEDRVDAKLRAAPSLKEILNPLDHTTGLVLLENTLNGSDFVTGLTELNKHRPIEKMSLSDRRKALFGTDALFP